MPDVSKAATRDLSTAEWKSAEGSGESDGQRIEVATNLFGEHGLVYVRDSSDPDGPVLGFTEGEWEAFLGGARDGEFDI